MCLSRVSSASAGRAGFLCLRECLVCCCWEKIIKLHTDCDDIIYSSMPQTLKIIETCMQQTLVPAIFLKWTSHVAKFTSGLGCLFFSVCPIIWVAPACLGVSAVLSWWSERVSFPPFNIRSQNRAMCFLSLWLSSGVSCIATDTGGGGSDLYDYKDL